MMGLESVLLLVLYLPISSFIGKVIWITGGDVVGVVSLAFGEGTLAVSLAFFYFK